jgi:2-iminobutanoate/2-iminopropanoate deaminase
VPLDPETQKMVEGDIQVQTRRVLDNLTAVLEAAGCRRESVVKVTVFLRDLGDFTAMNEVYGEYFSSSPPARATVEVGRLPADARIEIDCVASVS